MVVEKRREDLAARGTPALGGKLVRNSEQSRHSM